MEFRILGPLEVSEGEELLPIGGGKEKALLAVFLLNANRAVSIDRLIDDLWGEEVPETAQKMLQMYVSRLRKVLPRAILQTRSAGYELEIPPDDLDLSRFERLLAQGRRAFGENDADLARTKLDEALTLWRGPALVEFSEPFAASEAGRLEELRLQAVEERIEADLALGHHGELVVELEPLVARHPLRERLRAQQMLALYRAGRQAEALAAYQKARRTLADEFGLEPSPILRDLEGRILRQDDALLLDGEVERAQPVAPRQEPQLTLDKPTRPPEPADDPLPEYERRQLTVMFCDLVGSTPLASQLDPEDFREIVSAYQGVCVDVVDRLDGYIAQYSGDGIVVYFGYPRAHEDDARRAVRAGLALVDSMRVLNVRLEREWGIELSVRVGIHTGLAVVGAVGADGREELTATGETPAVAARLQAEADPNTVVVSPATHRLVDGYFTTEDLGERELEGLPEPIVVRRVLEETGALTRLDVPVSAELTPLVGRELELSVALDRWVKAEEGLGQVVLVIGEPGIGKSRLVRELTDQVEGDQFRSMVFRCSPYDANTAFHPVVEQLERWFGLVSGEPAEAKLEKLERGVRDSRISDPDAIPLLASLLSIPLADESLGEELTPQQQKSRTLELLSTLLVGEIARQPQLVVVEDLHWSDPSTLELLDLVVNEVPTSRLLLVVTTRPETQIAWASRSYVSTISLARLHQAEVADLVSGAVGGKTMPPEVIEQVNARTDGVPLFVEELVKTLIEGGVLVEQNGSYVLAEALPTLSIPETLQDSLMARLDNLGAAKTTAQLGATLGRQFHYELMEAVTQEDVPTMDAHLEQLVRAELLFQRGRPPAAQYQFKHALIRDAAYQSLLKRTRQEHHRQIAEVLVSRFPDVVETQPELVAHHYTEAKLPGPAVSFWRKAGERAFARFANAEAVFHFSNALEALGSVSDSRERTEVELSLRIPLGNALVAVRGNAAIEVDENYRRALELCEALGETPHVFPALWGCYSYSQIGAHYETALEFGERMLQLAEDRDDGHLLVAHRTVGVPLLSLGELARSHGHLQKAVEHARGAGESGLHLVYVHDPEVAARSYLSWVLWLLGYSDQARKQAQESIARAEALNHPLSLVFALGMSAMLHQFLGEPATVLEQGGATSALAAEQDMPLWNGWATAVSGWAMVKAGEAKDGAARVREGIEGARETGSEWSSSYFLGLLAEAERDIGNSPAALRILDEALAFAEDHRERFYMAEIHRLKGETLLQGEGPDSTGAEACFQKALDIAQAQESKSLQLRAATALARVLSARGDRESARAPLEAAFGWFSEGFGTRDLQDAKGLLEMPGLGKT